MTDDNPTMRPSREVQRLVEIMAALRQPGTGCPWDLEQTFETIAPYTIEEAYEVADAIERGDLLDLREELGDLLLQVVYHAQLAAEAEAFDFGDVVHDICAKMIRRHPHVFRDSTRGTLTEAENSWARIKAREKAAKAETRARLGLEAPDAPASVLDDVPRALPALTRAQKLQDKAAAVGFDWPSLAPVFDKMREELAELEEVARPLDPRAPRPARTTPPAASDTDDASHARIEEEFGDLMFVMANVARHLKLDPEQALRRANAKFTRRFAAVEARLRDAGSTPAESTLAEMDALWDAVKRTERGDDAN